MRIPPKKTGYARGTQVSTSLTNRETFGGNSKAGLGRHIGMGQFINAAIVHGAAGHPSPSVSGPYYLMVNNQDYPINKTNQLSRVGTKATNGMFGPSADGVNEKQRQTDEEFIAENISGKPSQFPIQKIYECNKNCDNNSITLNSDSLDSLGEVLQNRNSYVVTFVEIFDTTSSDSTTTEELRQVIKDRVLEDIRKYFGQDSAIGANIKVLVLPGSFKIYVEIDTSNLKNYTAKEIIDILESGGYVIDEDGRTKSLSSYLSNVSVKKAINLDNIFNKILLYLEESDTGRQWVRNTLTKDQRFAIGEGVLPSGVTNSFNTADCDYEIKLEEPDPLDLRPGQNRNFLITGSDSSQITNQDSVSSKDYTLSFFTGDTVCFTYNKEYVLKLFNLDTEENITEDNKRIQSEYKNIMFTFNTAGNYQISSVDFLNLQIDPDNFIHIVADITVKTEPIVADITVETNPPNFIFGNFTESNYQDISFVTFYSSVNSRIDNNNKILSQAITHDINVNESDYTFTDICYNEQKFRLMKDEDIGKNEVEFGSVILEKFEKIGIFDEVTINGQLFNDVSDISTCCQTTRNTQVNGLLICGKEGPEGIVDNGGEDFTMNFNINYTIDLANILTDFDSYNVTNITYYTYFGFARISHNEIIKMFINEEPIDLTTLNVSIDEDEDEEYAIADFSIGTSGEISMVNKTNLVVLNFKKNLDDLNVNNKFNIRFEFENFGRRDFFGIGSFLITFDSELIS